MHNPSFSIAVRGVGVVGAFGSGVAALEHALRNGDVSPDRIEYPGPDGALHLPAFRAELSALHDRYSRRTVRRLDRYSRLALLAGRLALEDAGLSDTPQPGLAVIVASGYGAAATTFAFLDSGLDDGDALASPTLFSHSVHNAAAAQLAILLGATGPCLTVSQFDLSFASALLSACLWLHEGRVERALVGGVDECCAVLGHCWERLCAPTSAAPVEPVNWARQSALPGEGAAFFVLERGETAPYGIIRAVQASSAGPGPIDARHDGVRILGAAGHRGCGPAYARLAGRCAAFAAYAPLWGSFPTAQALDLAAACLCARHATLFAPPGLDCGPARPLPLAPPMRLACTVMAPDGASGVISVER